MSAVIAFPRNARAVSERRRAVRESIIQRAKDRGATPQQKDEALALAFRMLDRGESAGWALAEATLLLPSVRTVSFRRPIGTPPEAA